MLNVSQVSQTTDKTYQNITILSRPLIQSSQSSSQSSLTTRTAQQQQHNESLQQQPQQPQQSTNNVSLSKSSSPTSSGYPSVQSTAVVSQPMACIGSQSQSQSLSSAQSMVPSLASLPSSTLSNGSQSLRSTLANIHNNDKSPMCLINELSRCNDIKHEYHLIDEFGPPHDKTFTVVLKLGESEEYQSSGPSIKKAQRSAASLALQQTKLRHPSPKVSKVNESKSMWPLTPTVELNVLAMKLGESAVYHVYEPPRPQPTAYPFGAIGATAATSAYDFRGMHYQRYHIPRGPYCATLNVGSRQFVGKGRTAQSARHAAAEEALKVLRELPLPSICNNTCNENKGDNESNDARDCNTANEDGIKSPISLVHEMALKRNLSVKFEVIGESGPSHMPKFVTQCSVGDIVTNGEGSGKKVSKKCAAIKMLEELKKLEPLPTLIKSDDNNKESGDQNVSGSVANNLRVRMPRRKPFIKKKRNNSNVIKDTSIKSEVLDTNDASINNNNINNNSNNANNSNNVNNLNINNSNSINKSEDLNVESSSNGSSSSTIHPINRLIQLQQARKEKEPQFNVVSERCTDRRKREFSIECTITISKGPNAPNVISAIGLGPNKKVAKKNAAEAMLQLLGYSSKPQPQSILKQDSSEGQQLQKKIRQVKFVEDNGGQQLVDISTNMVQTQPKLGRQLVPGLILMPTEVNVGLKNGTNGRTDTISMTETAEITSRKANNSSNNENISAKIKLVSVIANEFLESKVGVSETAIALTETEEPQNRDDKCEIEPQSRVHATEQLQQLADVIGSHTLQVHFSDFPKKHNNNQIEYLSVVTITTIWGSMPIVSHGTGSSQEESRDQASHQALIALSKLDESQYS